MPGLPRDGNVEAKSPCKDCPKPASTRGYCKYHYYRALRRGVIKVVSKHVATGRMGPAPKDAKERLLALITKDGPTQPHMSSPCWVRLDLDRDEEDVDYWDFYLDAERGHMGAHRASFILFVGPIADDMDACHGCDFRPCVNPEHLFAGSRFDNMEDASSKDRLWGRHKLTDESAEAIRRRVMAGEERRPLAEEYGISVGHVGRLLMEVAGKPCSALGCQRKAIAKGLCQKHYGRAKRGVL
jgi:hypothetical protein